MAEPLADLSDPLLCRISKLNELNNIMISGSICIMIYDKVLRDSASKNKVNH